jgi:N-acetylneuraminate synthase
MGIKPVKIGENFVGKSKKCYIIAEIGSNFDGSIKKAKKLIYAAKKCGADAAKFQSFKAEEFISKKGFENSPFESKFKNSAFDLYKQVELPRTWNSELNSYAKKLGIDFFTSPWDNDAVDDLLKINSPVIKIGSGDITNLEFLKYVGNKKKPVLLATGASTLREISEAVNVVKSTGNNKIILLHCVVSYPSPIEEANLRVLDTIRNKFQLNVGYSDHSPGDLVPLASVANGACVIEKHFTLNRTDNGPDHAVALDPDGFSKMVKNIRLLESALGDGIKKPMPSEKDNRIYYRRGIWTTTKIKKGDSFTSDNIKTMRPAKGLPASKFKFLLGKKAKRNFVPYQSLKLIDL